MRGCSHRLCLIFRLSSMLLYPLFLHFLCCPSYTLTVRWYSRHSGLPRVRTLLFGASYKEGSAGTNISIQQLPGIEQIDDRSNFAPTRATSEQRAAAGGGVHYSPILKSLGYWNRDFSPSSSKAWNVSPKIQTIWVRSIELQAVYSCRILPPNRAEVDGVFSRNMSKHRLAHRRRQVTNQVILCPGKTFTVACRTFRDRARGAMLHSADNRTCAI